MSESGLNWAAAYRSGPDLARFRHVTVSLYWLQKMQDQEMSDLMVVYSRLVFLDLWWQNPDTYDIV